MIGSRGPGDDRKVVKLFFITLIFLLATVVLGRIWFFYLTVFPAVAGTWIYLVLQNSSRENDD